MDARPRRGADDPRLTGRLTASTATSSATSTCATRWATTSRSPRPETALVEGVDIDVGSVGHGSSDGISLQNPQHVRITGNHVKSSDDGIYVWSSYRDPRGTSWWSSADPQPSKDIEIDHNTVEVFPACCKAVALIAWGANAPDLNQVAISDVLDPRQQTAGAGRRRLLVRRRAYTSASGDHAPIARVSVVGNHYVGDPTPRSQAPASPT